MRTVPLDHLQSASERDSATASRPLTWVETRARLRADYQRLSALREQEGQPGRTLVLHPSFVCVLLHRLSHHFHRAGHKYCGRLFWLMNAFLTGADISAPSDVRGGFLIVSPGGVSLSGNAGRNLTLMPLSGLGSELGRRQDVGAGPGLPVLGDDVTLGAHSAVLGPVRVGNRAIVSAGVIVTRDLADDAIAQGPEPKFLSRRDRA